MKVIHSPSSKLFHEIQWEFFRNEWVKVGMGFLKTLTFSVTKNLIPSIICKGYVPRVLEKMVFGHISHQTLMVLLKKTS